MKLEILGIKNDNFDLNKSIEPGVRVYTFRKHLSITLFFLSALIFKM